MRKQKLPIGLTQAKIDAILSHYENQTEDEAVAEDEAAFADRRFSTIQVPVELVDHVRRIIAAGTRAS